MFKFGHRPDTTCGRPLVVGLEIELEKDDGVREGLASQVGSSHSFEPGTLEVLRKLVVEVVLLELLKAVN